LLLQTICIWMTSFGNNVYIQLSQCVGKQNKVIAKGMDSSIKKKGKQQNETET